MENETYLRMRAQCRDELRAVEPGERLGAWTIRYINGSFTTDTGVIYEDGDVVLSMLKIPGDSWVVFEPEVTRLFQGDDPHFFEVPLSALRDIEVTA